LFKEGNFQGASLMYRKSTDCLSATEPSTPKQIEEVNSLAVPCFLNYAACALKLKEYSECVSACTKALKSEANNAKALFRRSVALYHLGDFEAALADCINASELAPEDIQIKRQLKEIKTAAEASLKKEAAIFKNMFR